MERDKARPKNGRCERTGFRVREHHTTERDPRSRLEAQSPKQFPSSALDRKTIALVGGQLVGRDGLSIASVDLCGQRLKSSLSGTGAFGTAKPVIKSRTGTVGGPVIDSLAGISAKNVTKVAVFYYFSTTIMSPLPFFPRMS